MNKTSENYVKLSDAVETVKRDYPIIASSAIGKALREKKIPHIRSSNGGKAHYAVRISDLREYAKKLTVETT
jgi:hypothetical protein